MKRNHRSAPRVMPVYPTEEVVIELPPTVPQPMGQPAWVVWLQVVGLLGGASGGVAYALMSRGNPNNALWWIPLLSVLMMLASLGSIVQQLTEPRRRKYMLAQRAKEYRQYLADQAVYIDTLADTQRREHDIVNPNVEECLGICANPQTQQPAPRMWERWRSNQKDAGDFLHCRVGIGRIASTYRVRPNQSPNRSVVGDPLVQELMNLVNSAKTVPGAAVTIPLPSIGVLGVRGDGQETLLRALLFHMVVHHSPADVTVSIACSPEQYPHWAWARWLPHIWNDNRTRRNVAIGQESLSTMLSDLIKMMQYRAEQVSDRINSQYNGIVHVACFVQCEEYLQRDDLFRQFMLILNEGPRFGIYVIILSENQLPRECRSVIEIQSITARYSENASARESVFTPDQVTLAQAERLARALAPWQSTSLNSDTSIPTRVSLLELMNVETIDQYSVAERWRKGAPWDTLAVPIGLGAGRLPITLDVQRHGPHGLGAGTTGSGKSELLLTFIAMLAANYSPKEVVFLLLDFKGEGMAGRVAQLPHLAGVLSNLSASQTSRILVSLNAELNKRQRIFKQHQINDINDYLSKRKHDTSLPVMPIMLIIADEFAQLKDEQPEFIDQLVGVARIGRSLGIRLLLTTQNPSGVVTKQIATNTSYRFCLRVASRDDSIDLIGNPDAAYLPGRGAGFLKMGEFQPIQFQSGYTGDQYALIEHEAPIINTVDAEGARTQIVGPKLRMSDETQLEYLVGYIKRVADAENLSQPYQVWAPPLPDVPPTLAHVAHQYDITPSWDGTKWTRKNTSELKPLIGIYDDPASQKQGELYLALSDRNHAGIFVAAGESRALFIRTFVGAIATQYAPNEVQCIFLDFGVSGLLRPYEQLPHTIAVTSANQTEMIARIQNRVSEEMAKRARVLGGLTFAAYQASQPNPLSRIVILIDNMVELRESSALRYLNEVIERVAQNGAPLGIHLVVMLNRAAEAGSKINQQFGVNVGIGVSTDMVYELTNKRNFVIDDAIIGRGVISGINCEIQLATVADGGELAQMRAIEQMMNDMNQNQDYSIQHQIREIPDRLTMAFLSRKLASTEHEFLSTTFMLNLDSEQPESLSLLQDGPYFLITGGAGSGKSTTLLTWCQLMTQKPLGERLRIFVMSNGSTPLFQMQHNPHVVSYDTQVAKWPELIKKLDHALTAHRQYFQSELDKGNVLDRAQMLEKLPAIVLVIDTDRWGELDALDTQTHQDLARLLQDSRDLGLFVIAAGESQQVKSAKNNQCAFTNLMLNKQLILAMNIHEDSDFDVALPGVYARAEREGYMQGMRQGRALLVKNQQRTRLQIAVID
jgi:DNA segregation ATPase FtsK/SpoIIIE, S-DNA-T family